MQIFNHGLTAAALFYYAGLLEQRCGRRSLADFGGLMQRTPLLCGWMSVAMFSSLGLPGLNGFIGEFLIFKGAFRSFCDFDLNCGHWVVDYRSCNPACGADRIQRAAIPRLCSIS